MAEAGYQLWLEQSAIYEPGASGAKIRTVGKLVSVEEKGGMLEVINEMTVEIDGADKPACVAEACFASSFKLIFA